MPLLGLRSSHFALLASPNPNCTPTETHACSRCLPGVVCFRHMAAKKPTKKRKASLDTILATVERGFADLEGKMERGFAAVAEDIADIRKTTATKEDIARLDKKMERVDAKIDRVDSKLSAFEDHEIDKRLQLEVRVSAIEKRLGINKKIAV